MTSLQIPADFSAALIHLNSPDGSRVAISPYGAHVLSWVTSDGDERLFLSPRTAWRKGEAIRGGVPVIFPQFSTAGPLVRHGFARTSDWHVLEVTPVSARFQLADNDATRAAWPQAFLVEYLVRLAADSLELELVVSNRGAIAMNFTAALHTYLRVSDISAVAVSGLQGCRFSENGVIAPPQRDREAQVSFPGEVDRLYPRSPAELRLVDTGRELRISSQGFPDAVVWNPGPERCAALKDVLPDGYRSFVCVEAAAAAQPLLLTAGQSWRGAQVLSR